MLIISIIVFILALILVIYGGDMFVDSSIVIAKRFKIPTIIIGATIVSIATTLPELIVSTISAIQGSYDLAVGNAVGSIICNTALIGGLSMAIIPSAIKEKTSKTKYLLLIFASFLLLVCGFGANTSFNISWIESLIFLILFVFYMLVNVYDAMCQMTGKRGLTAIIRKKQKENEKLENLTVLESVDTNKIGLDNPDTTEIIIEQKDNKVEAKAEEKFPKLYITLLFFIMGAGMIALGAFALVESACTNFCVLATEFPLPVLLLSVINGGSNKITSGFSFAISLSRLFVINSSVLSPLYSFTVTFHKPLP